MTRASTDDEAEIIEVAIVSWHVNFPFDLLGWPITAPQVIITTTTTSVCTHTTSAHLPNRSESTSNLN